MAQTSLKLENISYCNEDEQILDGISFSLNAGEVSCLVGPSGCGKTTLLRLIAGLISPDQGTIHLDDHDINSSEWEPAPG